MAAHTGPAGPERRFADFMDHALDASTEVLVPARPHESVIAVHGLDEVVDRKPQQLRHLLERLGPVDLLSLESLVELAPEGRRIALESVVVDDHEAEARGQRKDRVAQDVAPVVLTHEAASLLVDEDAALDENCKARVMDVKRNALDPVAARQIGARLAGGEHHLAGRARGIGRIKVSEPRIMQAAELGVGRKPARSQHDGPRGPERTPRARSVAPYDSCGRTVLVEHEGEDGA